jgi:uncharacterized membrane protein YdbT with pleckstrin-like domain
MKIPHTFFQGKFQLENINFNLKSGVAKQLVEYLLQTQAHSKELAKISLNCWAILFDEVNKF